jgi:hypothetical protein
VRCKAHAFQIRWPVLDVAGDQVRWLTVLLALCLGTGRVTFINAELKPLLGDAYVVVALAMALKLINLAGDVACPRGRLEAFVAVTTHNTGRGRQRLRSAHIWYAPG